MIPEQIKIILFRVFSAAVMAVFIKLLISYLGYEYVGKIGLIVISGELLKYLGSFGVQIGIMQTPQALSRPYYDLTFTLIGIVIITIIYCLLSLFFGEYIKEYSLFYACSMLIEEVYVSTLKRAQKPILASSITLFSNLLLITLFAFLNQYSLDILLIFSSFKAIIPFLSLVIMSINPKERLNLTQIRIYYPFLKKSIKGMTIVPILSISVLWLFKNFASTHLPEKTFGVFESSFKVGYNYLLLIHSGLMIKYHTDTVSTSIAILGKMLGDIIRRAMVYFLMPCVIVYFYHDKIWSLLYAKTGVINSDITIIIMLASVVYFISEFVAWTLYIGNNFWKFNSIYFLRLLLLLAAILFIENIDVLVLAQIWMFLNLITLLYSFWMFRISLQ